MQFPEFLELYNSKIIFEKVGEKIKSCTNKNRLFIYQRYSLNNFASILLSNEYNIPTVIEYNGSEVWIRENWGKGIRSSRVSKKVERLVLQKSTLIVCVSDALKTELIKMGINQKKS